MKALFSRILFIPDSWHFVAAKIRRLYDIANILSSLELICKVHVTGVRGRKPAFQYIGPAVELDDDVMSGWSLFTSSVVTIVFF